MRTDIIFDYAREALGVFAHVSLLVGTARELDCGFEAQAIFAALAVP